MKKIEKQSLCIGKGSPFTECTSGQKQLAKHHDKSGTECCEHILRDAKKSLNLRIPFGVTIVGLRLSGSIMRRAVSNFSKPIERRHLKWYNIDKFNWQIGGKYVVFSYIRRCTCI